jgi:hypothetical protein
LIAVYVKASARLVSSRGPQVRTERTGHLPFDWIGIPGFKFMQDPIDSVPNPHYTNQDICDHYVPEDLIQCAIVMAPFTYHTAMRERMLHGKPPVIPVEVKEKLSPQSSCDGFVVH